MSETNPESNAPRDPAGGDDFEYEVEPPDPDVLASQEQLRSERAAELIGRAESNRDPVPESYEWTEDFRLAFSLRDAFVWIAMIATALVALRVAGLCFAFTVLLAEAFVWTLLASEKAHRERLRQAGVPVSAGLLTAEAKTAENEKKPRFSFSVADLMIATTIASFGLGLSTVLPTGLAAAMLGTLVLICLVFYWMGLEPGRRMMLIWLMLTATWLLISAKAMLNL